MSIAIGRVDVLSLRSQIVQAVRAGGTVEQIERLMIAPAPLDEEQKSALWLYAHALHDQHGDPVGRRPLAIGPVSWS